MPYKFDNNLKTCSHFLTMSYGLCKMDCLAIIWDFRIQALFRQHFDEKWPILYRRLYRHREHDRKLVCQRLPRSVFTTWTSEEKSELIQLNHSLGPSRRLYHCSLSVKLVETSSFHVICGHHRNPEWTGNTFPRKSSHSPSPYGFPSICSWESWWQSAEDLDDNDKSICSF